jgi:ATP-dependent helicase HrpA
VGRINASIEPEWVEPLAGPPRQARAQRTALELQERRGDGVRTRDAVRRPDRRQRRVLLGPIDPQLAGAVHPHALVEGTGTPTIGSSTTTGRCSPRSPELEERARRRDIVVSDEVLFDFYDQRIGPDVVSARHFDTWWKRTRPRSPGPAHVHPRVAAQRRREGLRPRAASRAVGATAAWTCR